MLVTTDALFVDATDPLIGKLSGAFVRGNEGYDFGAWAHFLRTHSDVLKSEILYLLNDSIVGPISEEAMRNALDWIRKSEADSVGMTDSFELRWHMQSFFVAYKPKALSSPAFREFWHEVVSYEDKFAVIDAYELPMARMLSAGDLQSEVLFPATSRRAINRSTVEWRELIGEGFPFIKIVTIRDEQAGVDITDWQAVMTACGFDPAIVEEAVRDAKGAAISPGTGQAMTMQQARDSRGEPDELSLPEFYLIANPDVAATGLDPLADYASNGRGERRLAFIPGARALKRLSHDEGSKETVLIVSHDGVRSGCPILSYNIIKGLVDDYNVIALFFESRPMLEACREIGAVVIGPIAFANRPQIADAVVGHIAETVPIKFAITNSVEARHALPALAKRYIPSLSLIHEFTAYIRPIDAFREAVHWAGRTVFSTQITHDDAINTYPDLGWQEHPIIPQGRCIVPQDDDLRYSAVARSAEFAHVKKLLRPDDFSKSRSGKKLNRQGRL